MRAALLVSSLAVLFTSFAVAQNVSQTPFDLYVRSVKNHQFEQRLVKSVSACGLDFSRSHAVYGTNNGSAFTGTNDFAKGVYSLESDSFSTAALWSEGSHRAIDFWSIDDSEGSESDYVICVDPSGKATSIEMTSWFMPIEPGFSGWKCTRLVKFDSDGAIVRGSLSFVDLRTGKKIARPHLESDQKIGLDWIPGQAIVREILSELKETRKK